MFQKNTYISSIVIHIYLFLPFVSSSHFRYSTSLKLGRDNLHDNKPRNINMGLHKNYLKVGQNASNQIFGIPRVPRGSTPLSMLISYGAKFNSSKSLDESLLGSY